MSAARIKQRVLIVESDGYSRDVLARAVKAFGYEVAEAKDVPSAHDKLAEPTPFDLVISDFSLADDPDRLLLKELATQAPNFAVIISIAMSDTKLALEFLRLGVYDYVIKPFDLGTLHRAVSRTEEIRRLQLENIAYRQELEFLVEQKTKELMRRTRDLAATRLAMVRGLCRLVEYRDVITGAHLERMAAYCGILARDLYQVPDRACEMGPDYVDFIVEAAPLHDIGKVAIPDAILRKAGGLTPEEEQVMRQHTVLGQEAVGAILKWMNKTSDPMLNMAMDIAAQHHEWWNGKGYPYGKTGEGITLGARIAAVADFFDACTSSRDYRPVPMDGLETARLIESKSGEQFDPEIVTLFSKNLEEILATHASMAD